MQADPRPDDPLAAALGCLRARRPAHLMGITGVGQAALAHLLRAQGCAVSGCDREPGPLRGGLVQAGVAVAAGHDPVHVNQAASPGWLIRSTAVPPAHPECLAAEARGWPVLRRGEVLAALTRLRPTVAVAGCHGKTSTTTLLAQMLHHAGRPVGYAIGAETPGLAACAPGGADPWLVAEADESDGTLALYAAAIAIITNIEFDHAEYFPNPAALLACFRTFIAACQGPLLYWAEDPLARELAAAHPQSQSYGFNPGCRWRVQIKRVTAANGQDLVFFQDGRALGQAWLPVAGRHQALNALAALAAGCTLDHDPQSLIAALPRYTPPRRRFETVGAWHGAPIVSDYAHHPTEIRATLTVARATGRRLIVLFQPHRPSRTAALGPLFAPAFAGAEQVILAPVYAASEPPCPNGDSASLAPHFNAAGIPCSLAPSLEAAWEMAGKHLESDALLLLIGAGDLEQPLARLTPGRPSPP